MKKLMFTAAVAAAGLAFGLESANTVGYYNKTLNNVFKVRAAQFETTASESFKVSDAVSCTSPVAVSCWADRDNWEYNDGWDDTAPQIQVQNASGVFEPFFYVSDARVYDELGNESFVEGWADASGMLADANDIPSGSGIWLRGYKNGTETVADTEFTFSGQVMADASGDIAGENMFKVRAMPYPIEQALNSAKCVWSALTPVSCWSDRDAWEYNDGWDDTAPQIQVLKASGVFEPFFYVSDARVYDELGSESFVTGWADASGMLAREDENNGIVRVGDGIWFNARKANVSCTISK